MANSFVNIISEGSYDVPKNRFEELIKNEQKYFQYKAEMERMGEDGILSIIEAKNINESEEKENE